MKTIATLAVKLLFSLMILVCIAFVVNTAYQLYLHEYAQATYFAVIGSLFILLTHTTHHEIWTPKNSKH